jgi:hypothetical protein
MARWTGDPHIGAVLKAADVWRERCVLGDKSLLSDEALWTFDNIRDLKTRFSDHPIEGSDRDFYDKLKEQLDKAQAQVIRLAAEVTWFLDLFPHYSKFGVEKKLEHIRTVWGWSGAPLPKSPYLDPPCLMGVGNPGTAYLTRRNEQYGFFLDVFERWKILAQAERERLMTEDAPWTFVQWLDGIPHSEQRPMRNAILYFLFPDTLERNLSNQHRRQIVYALQYKIPLKFRPKSSPPTLLECDRALFALRQVFESELKTKNYGLELSMCGSKKKRLSDCYPVDASTGFWENPADATNKPLRWILHLAIEGDHLVAKLPGKPGNRRIAFANTAQGLTGGVTARIVPAIKLGDGKYVFYETWEWLILFCFLPALNEGSSGQLFDDFDPATGELRYKNKKQNYIAAALITLHDRDDEFVSENLPRPIQYGEATAAIIELINAVPTIMTPPTTSEASDAV